VNIKSIQNCSTKGLDALLGATGAKFDLAMQILFLALLGGFALWGD
jgi:hypothetical protein